MQLYGKKFLNSAKIIKTMNKNIFIKSRKRKKKEFQFFMHQFVESAIRSGIKPKKEYFIHGIGKLIHLLSKVIRKAPNKHSKQAIIITSRGEGLIAQAFPYFYKYEIIPMLWDVWPQYWDTLYNDIQKLNCKIIFVTVRSMADKIRKDLHLKAYWIPEGIDVKDYNKGNNLCNRIYDIYELGRLKKDYHLLLLNLKDNKIIKHLFHNTYDINDKLIQLAFPTSQSLLDNLSNFKIIISFPQIDTHPQNAGGIETLTQRYWEAMLSRCLIIGRAPQELIDLIGYNPVINVNWNTPQQQIIDILNNIQDYQDFVEKNYNTALRFASWDNRMNEIKKILQENGYICN